MPAINLVIGILVPVAVVSSSPEAWASEDLQSLSAPGRHTGSAPGRPGWGGLSPGDPDGRSVPGNALRILAALLHRGGFHLLHRHHRPGTRMVSVQDWERGAKGPLAGCGVRVRVAPAERVPLPLALGPAAAPVGWDRPGELGPGAGSECGSRRLCPRPGPTPCPVRTGRSPAPRGADWSRRSLTCVTDVN